MPARFLVARNPDESSTLPYLLRVPVAGPPLLLKAKDAWPRTAKVYCHRLDAWPDAAEIIEDVGVRPLVFAGSRKLAEEWTYRFLAAAYAEAVGDRRFGDGSQR